MSEQESYFTIEKTSTAEFKDRGSKFTAYVFPVKTADDFKKHLQDLKKEHPKAVHHCFAYRLGTDGNNFRSYDDGEPSGSAGKPILGQIDKRQLTDVAVIVVRYFGGTLLGVPGLINAYKTSTALALQLTPLVQKQIEIKYSIHFDYTQMNEVLVQLRKYNCTILSQEMQLFCIMKVGISKSRLLEVLHHLKEIQRLELEIVNE